MCQITTIFQLKNIQKQQQKKKKLLKSNDPKKKKKKKMMMMEKKKKRKKKNGPRGKSIDKIVAGYVCVGFSFLTGFVFLLKESSHIQTAELWAKSTT